MEPEYPPGGLAPEFLPLPHVPGMWPCYPQGAAPLPTCPCTWERLSLSVPPALLACSLSLPAAAPSSSMSPSSRSRLQPPSPTTNPIPCSFFLGLHWARFHIPLRSLPSPESSFISPSHAHTWGWTFGSFCPCWLCPVLLISASRGAVENVPRQCWSVSSGG